MRESFVRHEVMTDEIGASHGESERGPSFKEPEKHAKGTRFGTAARRPECKRTNIIPRGTPLKKQTTAHSVCQMAGETKKPNSPKYMINHNLPNHPTFKEQGPVAPTLMHY